MQPAFTPDQQAYLDAQQLKTLSIFYYLIGAFMPVSVTLAAMMSLGGLFSVPPSATNQAFLVLLFALLGIVFGSLVAYAGFSLNKQRNRGFIQVIAAFVCLSMPFGTILGIFTFIALSRPSVRALFDQPPVTPPPTVI